MSVRGRLIDLLRGVEGEEQFLGRKEEKEWQLKRSVEKMEGGLIPGGQNRIHRGIVFRGQGSFGEVKRIQWPGLRRAQ